jgi:hypothetical protein
VISSTAAAHDPAGFVRALGSAYRATLRTRPIVDTFGHNPYPRFSAEPPWTQHASDPTIVGQADLPRLLDALQQAFGGTAQPAPSATRPMLWYLELGFQTSIPPAKRRFYHGAENDQVLAALAEYGEALGGEHSDRDQAGQLEAALALAYCQPEVGAYFNFELLDEARLSGWQSGLLWRDGTQKPSYAAFKETVAAVEQNQIDCNSVRGLTRP